MNRPAFLKACAPYKVHSCANGQLVVKPKYPKGYSGVLSRFGLAHDLQKFLNAVWRTKP